MKNMRTDVLRTFVTVAQIGGFTQAGELLGRSQPAISLQIKGLEKMLGQALLIRSGMNVELTHSGQVLFEYAKKILNLNDEALGQLDNAAIYGKVKLGIPSEFATTLLPKIIGRFINAYPNVILEVHCDLSKNLLIKSKRKKYDLILALQDDPQKEDSNRVKTDELVWVSSDKHDVHLLPEVPLIAAFEGCIYRKRAIAKLTQKKRPWRLVYTIPDLTGIEAAIQEGLGVTVLAKSTVPDNLVIIKESDKLPKLGEIGITLIHNESNSNQAIDRLLEFLRISLVMPQ